MANIKARWEMEDRARAIAQAEDENHQRGQEWRRRETKLEAMKRVCFGHNTTTHGAKRRGNVTEKRGG